MDDNNYPTDIQQIVRGRVMIRRDAPSNKIGSLFVPNGEETWPTTGEVLGIAPAREPGKDTDLLRAEGIAVGSRVLFKSRAHGGGKGALLPDERERSSLPGDWERVIVLEAEDILGEVVS